MDMMGAAMGGESLWKVSERGASSLGVLVGGSRYILGL